MIWYLTDATEKFVLMADPEFLFGMEIGPLRALDWALRHDEGPVFGLYTRQKDVAERYQREKGIVPIRIPVAYMGNGKLIDECQRRQTKPRQWRRIA